MPSYDDAEYEEPPYEESRYVVGDDVELAGSGARGQRGLRPVPQVGAGLAVCVDDDADGVGELDDEVGFGLAADCVATGFGADVVSTVVVVRAGFGPYVGRDVAFGFAVAVGTGGCVEGTDVGRAFSAVGLTLTWRLDRSSPPNVVGTTLSGSAWKPMNASMAVATVASITMTMLDSSEPPRALSRVTAVTSPVVVAGVSAFLFGRNPNGLYPRSYVV